MLLICGMSEEQIWHGDPRMFRSYMVADELRKTYDNQKAWQQGLYTYNALLNALGNMFSNKSSKELTYFEKPIEEFNYYIVENDENEKLDIKEDKHKKQYNYWAKLKNKAREESRKEVYSE